MIVILQMRFYKYLSTKLLLMTRTMQKGVRVLNGQEHVVTQMKGIAKSLKSARFYDINMMQDRGNTDMSLLVWPINMMSLVVSLSSCLLRTTMGLQ